MLASVMIIVYQSGEPMKCMCVTLNPDELNECGLVILVSIKSGYSLVQRHINYVKTF